MASNPEGFSRFILYQGRWVLMDTNVGRSQATAQGENLAEASIWVRNAEAAHATELRRLVREALEPSEATDIRDWNQRARAVLLATEPIP